MIIESEIIDKRIFGRMLTPDDEFDCNEHFWDMIMYTFQHQSLYEGVPPIEVIGEAIQRAKAFIPESLMGRVEYQDFPPNMEAAYPWDKPGCYCWRYTPEEIKCFFCEKITPMGDVKLVREAMMSEYVDRYTCGCRED